MDPTSALRYRDSPSRSAGPRLSGGAAPSESALSPLCSRARRAKLDPRQRQQSSEYAPPHGPLNASPCSPAPHAGVFCHPGRQTAPEARGRRAQTAHLQIPWWAGAEKHLFLVPTYRPGPKA